MYRLNDSMNSTAVVRFFVCLAVLLIATPSAAAGADTIPGFEGYRWGESQKEIIEKKGEPTKKVDNMLAYSGDTSTKYHVAGFYFSEDAGLIKMTFGWQLDYDEIESDTGCLEFFRVAKKTVNQTVSIKPKVQKFKRYGFTDEISICDSIQKEGAEIQYLWEGGNGNFLEVRNYKGNIYVTAGTPKFLENYEDFDSETL